MSIVQVQLTFLGTFQLPGYDIFHPVYFRMSMQAYISFSAFGLHFFKCISLALLITTLLKTWPDQRQPRFPYTSRFICRWYALPILFFLFSERCWRDYSYSRCRLFEQKSPRWKKWVSIMFHYELQLLTKHPSVNSICWHLGAASDFDIESPPGHGRRETR